VTEAKVGGKTDTAGRGSWMEQQKKTIIQDIMIIMEDVET